MPIKKKFSPKKKYIYGRVDEVEGGGGRWRWRWGKWRWREVEVPLAVGGSATVRAPSSVASPVLLRGVGGEEGVGGEGEGKGN